MLFRIAADLVVLGHLAFILFVILGGLLALKWRRLIWLHLPAVIWGVLIEFAGWICPLTPVENLLRRASGDNGYAGDFIAHYLVPLIYPTELARDTQITLGVGVIAINVIIYAVLHQRWKHPPLH